MVVAADGTGRKPPVGAMRVCDLVPGPSDTPAAPMHMPCRSDTFAESPVLRGIRRPAGTLDTPRDSLAAGADTETGTQPLHFLHHAASHAHLILRASGCARRIPVAPRGEWRAAGEPRGAESSEGRSAQDAHVCLFHKWMLGTPVG